MNILELLAKSPDTALVEQQTDSGEGWRQLEPAGLFAKRSSGLYGVLRGLHLPPGSRLSVRGAARYFPNFARGLGFFYASSTKGRGRVLVGWNGLNSAEIDTSTEPRMLPVPATEGAEEDLVLEVPRDVVSAQFLGVHAVLDRARLYELCTGEGVEIGPGARPQIFNSDSTHVRYVEQATPDQWAALYGIDRIQSVDRSLWEHYVVGNADAIPAPMGSLDFIFSSHVLEHLANPLGHLAYWRTLLRPGGRVVAVVPDREGCKDCVFQNSTLMELVTELRAGSMTPELRHYERWNRHRMTGNTAQEIYVSGRSIHVHFYTAESMRRILEASHRELGFSRFEVISNANHKDFFLVLHA